METLVNMRLRKAPYSEFKRISSSLDDFSSLDASSSLFINRISHTELELKENDLISIMNPQCPQCGSHNVVKNGTCKRTMENGMVFRIQRYMCTNCRYSFVARPPSYGYGKHFPNEIKDKSVKSRVKTSLRKTANLFHIIGNIIISHETVRRNIPSPETHIMKSSGYFVYDEQYVHINGEDRYRALLKDSKSGLFVEEILDDLSQSTLTGFFIRSLNRFIIPNDIFITTDGYHYESSLIEAGRFMGRRIRRQRCLFHLEKYLAHEIRNAHREKELEPAKNLVKYMFFQSEKNLNRLGKNRESIMNLTKGKSESEIVNIVMEIIQSMYGEDMIISGFLDFIRKHRKEVFPYLKDPNVEKTSDKAEQHFSIQSWLFKHRFKTNEGLLSTSFWYHHYLSTGM